MDNTEDNCKKVLRWSQYGPICWFMAILSVMFHSQRSRNLLLNLSENWARKLPQIKKFDNDIYNPAGKNIVEEKYTSDINSIYNRLIEIDNLLINYPNDDKLLKEREDVKIKFFKIKLELDKEKNDEFNNMYYDIKSKEELYYLIRHILKYKYIHSNNEEEDKKFFRLFSGEIILKYLFNIEPSYLTENTNKEGWISHLLLNKFYEILNVNCLMLEVFPETKNVYYHLDNHYIAEGKNYIVSNTIELDEEKMNKILNFKQNPDILIIQLNAETYSENKYIYRKTISHYNITQKIGKDNSENILNLNDSIEYNNNKYILDSIILSNYNNQKSGHAIAGITCDNNRYVYNGWTKYSDDKGINNKENISRLNACEIIKYNWSIKNQNNFCLNPQKCSLPNLESNSEKEDLCFSFSKGKRILIYVKEKSSENSKYNDIFKTQSFKPFSYSVNSIKKDSNNISINSTCSSSSFLIKKRMTNCFNTEEFINKILKIKDVCLQETEIDKYVISFDEYTVKLEDIIYFEIKDNWLVRNELDEDIKRFEFKVIYNAIINQNFETTVMLHSKNEISNKLFKQTSKIVKDEKNPHFLYVYKSFPCDKSYTILKPSLSFKNYEIYITEKINGTLTDLIKNIKNDDIKQNILTQIILCIHSIHSFTSYCLVNTSNTDIFENMAYMNVENNVYIKYLWNGNIYYLKSFGYLVLFNNYSYLNSYNSNDVNLKKITKPTDIYNDYSMCLFKYRNNINIEKNKDDDFYLQYFIDNKIINLITLLPNNAKILNEKPYFLGHNNNSENSDWANNEYNTIFKTPSIKSLKSDNKFNTDKAWKQLASIKSSQSSQSSHLSQSNNQPSLNSMTKTSSNNQPSLHSMTKINSNPPNKPIPDIPSISIESDIKDIINKIDKIINSYNELNKNIKNIHVKGYTFTKIKSFIKQDNSTQKNLNEFIEKCDIILTNNDNIIKEIDKLMEQLNIKCNSELKGGDYSSEKYRIKINEYIQKIIKDKEDLLKNIKDCNSINYLLKPFITNLKYYTNQIKAEYNNIKNKYYKPLK